MARWNRLAKYKNKYLLRANRQYTRVKTQATYSTLKFEIIEKRVKYKGDVTSDHLPLILPSYDQ